MQEVVGGNVNAVGVLEQQESEISFPDNNITFGLILNSKVI